MVLRDVGVEIAGHVISIGRIRVSRDVPGCWDLAAASEKSDLRMADPVAARKAAAVIDRAKGAGSTVGGTVEVIARGVPPGLGSYVSWDKRLDGRLAHALMSIPAIKGVEIGGGFPLTALSGDAVHDEVFPGKGRGKRLFRGMSLPFHRKTNRAGGIEGGMTNGDPVVVQAAMKPIPTQSNPLRTVTIGNWKRAKAHRERSDVCAVPACSVVAEAMVAIVLASAFLEKFGGDSMSEIHYNYSGYLRRIGCR
jgi:chorismate synthase